MTKAQNDFISRVDGCDNQVLDSREFSTWYHPDDIYRIAYQTYKNQLQDNEIHIHLPVMVLGSESHGFEDKMAFCLEYLQFSEKQILPFMIAPEIGAVHFMSGFIRINQTDDKPYPEIFLFNPTGYTKLSASKRLSIQNMDSVANMVMHVSSLQIQTIDKDQVENQKSPSLVSCGPISLMFIEYILKNPNYALQLDDSFELPIQISQLGTMDKMEYQQTVNIQRQVHYELLGRMSDEILDEVDGFHYDFTEQFFNQDITWGDTYQ